MNILEVSSLMIIIERDNLGDLLSFDHQKGLFGSMATSNLQVTFLLAELVAGLMGNGCYTLSVKYFDPHIAGSFSCWIRLSVSFGRLLGADKVPGVLAFLGFIGGWPCFELFVLSAELGSPNWGWVSQILFHFSVKWLNIPKKINAMLRKLWLLAERCRWHLLGLYELSKRVMTTHRFIITVVSVYIVSIGSQIRVKNQK